MTKSPWEWVRDNLDGLVIALFAGLSVALIAAMLRGPTAKSVFLSLLASFSLISIVVPVAAIYGRLDWWWWPLIGAGLGITSLQIMWSVIRAADRVQQRAPDIGDALVNKVTGGTSANSEGKP